MSTDDQVMGGEERIQQDTPMAGGENSSSQVLATFGGIGQQHAQAGMGNLIAAGQVPVVAAPVAQAGGRRKGFGITEVAVPVVLAAAANYYSNRSSKKRGGKKQQQSRKQKQQKKQQQQKQQQQQKKQKESRKQQQKKQQSRKQDRK